MAILRIFPVFTRLSAQKKTLQMLLHKVSFSIRVLLSGVALKHKMLWGKPILIFWGKEICVFNHHGKGGKMAILRIFPVFTRLSAQKKTLQMLLHKVSFSIDVLLSGVALKHKNYFARFSLIAACAAARRAIGTRNGEQET